MAKERKEIHVTSTFDIETERWDIPVLCGMFTRENGYRETRSISELARWLLETPGFHWAHNGGKFDALAILDVWRAEGRNVTAVFAGGRIIALKCGASTLCDSAALWPATLAEITTGQANSKDVCPLPCVCPDACGGYCSIRRDMPETHYDLLSGYLRKDCVSLHDALDTLIEFAEDNDLDLTLTIGSSAFHTAARWLNLERDRHNLSEHAFRRRAYFGGRVQVFFLGNTGPGTEYDVVSMYASLLKNLPLPIGTPRAVSGSDAALAFYKGRPGIYSVHVTVPEQFIPPLPFRTKKRLWYPHGTFQSAYTQIELQNAIDKYGVQVHGFGDARVFSEAKPVFGAFIDKVFELRKQAGKKTPMGDFLKRKMNSVYGKLASKPEKERMMINPPSIREGDIQRADDVFVRKVSVVDDCAHPIWAAYITSAGRIMLGDKLHEGPTSDALYCDTDGVAVRGERDLGIGESIGQWERSDFIDRLQIAPKVYARFLSEPNKHGDLIESRAKGLRVKRNEIPAIGAEYKAARAIKGAKGIGKGGRDSFFEKSETTRKLKQTSGDRWIGENGVTYAHHISECK